MTILESALADLRQRRVQLDAAVLQIEATIRALTNLGAPAAPVTAPTKAATPRRAAPACKRTAAPAKTEASASQVDAEPLILHALRAKPLSTAEVVAATKLSQYHVKATLAVLVAAKRVIFAGATLSSRWALPPAQKSTAPSSDFMVAWNGTKEARGEAPSLLPPRDRKAG